MQVVGFNLIKILAKRELTYKRSAINTNIEFTNIEKESLPVLKDDEAIKISFKFDITYGDQEKTPDKKEKEEKQAEISFEGIIILSATKDEAKEYIKNWKKKEVPQESAIPLYNTILKRCSIKALQLEEDLNLPTHIPFPQVRAQPKDN